MTVEQAVLSLIIEHVKRGERFVKNHLIETAHPVHQLSGRSRLRGLRKLRLIDYQYHDKDNTYEILTGIDGLMRAWEIIGGRRRIDAFYPNTATGKTREIEPIKRKEDELISIDEFKEFKRTL